MDNAWKAHEQIDTLSTQIATVICEHSLTIDDVGALLSRMMQHVQMHVHLGVNTPEFQRRLQDHHQRIAAQQLTDGNAKLVEQLGSFGIDPKPIFADRPQRDE